MAESGFRRSPGGAVLLLKEEPGSRRSPGGAVLLLMEEPGSRRSPGGAVLLSISAAGNLYPIPVPLLSSLNFKRRKYAERDVRSRNRPFESCALPPLLNARMSESAFR